MKLNGYVQGYASLDLNDDAEELIVSLHPNKVTRRSTIRVTVSGTTLTVTFSLDDDTNNIVDIKKFDDKKRKLVPYNNPVGNAFHGFITLIVERLRLDGLTYYKKFYDFKEYRNNVSHPGKKQPDTEKCVALLENLTRIY
jgi:hypothetical protein